MGRHRLNVRSFDHGYRGGPRWSDPYHCEWSVVVGDRIRRLRNARSLTLGEMTDLVAKPDGDGRYSAGYLSRLERGNAGAPLYVYLAIAVAFDLSPGRLLGADDAERDARGR